MVNWRQEAFDEWSRDIQALIDDTKKPLRYAEIFQYCSSNAVSAKIQNLFLAYIRLYNVYKTVMTFSNLLDKSKVKINNNNYQLYDRNYRIYINVKKQLRQTWFSFYHVNFME
jgi:hypothetical protein